MPNPVIVGSAGPSGAGKTEVVSQAIIARYGAAKVLHISLDDFYKNFTGLTKTEKDNIDWDDPAVSQDISAIKTVISACLRGDDTVIVPGPYNFAAHSPSAETKRISPSQFDVIIFEGNFALIPELQALYHLRIYTHASSYNAFSRRARRDQNPEGRNRPIQQTLAQYEASVNKGLENYIKPSRIYAEIVVDNNRNDAKPDMTAVFTVLDRLISERKIHFSSFAAGFVRELARAAEGKTKDMGTQVDFSDMEGVVITPNLTLRAKL